MAPLVTLCGACRSSEPGQSGGPDDTAPVDSGPDDTGHDSGDTDTNGPPPFALWVNEDVSKAVREKVYPQTGAVQSFLLTQWYFDENNDGVLDPTATERLQAGLAAIPAGSTIPVCLDWEGVAMGALHGSLPLREYWERDAAWEDQNAALAPILDASDILFPSVYDFYQEGEHDLDYVRDNVEQALLMAKGKPVYPYVWHRWHDSNPTLGGQLIGQEERVAHAAAIFDAEVSGDRADGLVWWGADRWFAGSGDPFWAAVVAAEVPKGMDQDAWFDLVHADRLQWYAGVLAAAQP